MELIERLEPEIILRNQQVAGSIPAGGSIYFIINLLWLSWRAPVGKTLISRSVPEGAQQPQSLQSLRISVVGQFELTHYLPETSAMKPATKRWISAGGRL